MSEEYDRLCAEGLTRTTVEREFPYRAFLRLSSWAGDTYQEVEVIGETPKRFRIRALADTRLGGRSRWLATDWTTVVPKGAISKERR